MTVPHPLLAHIRNPRCRRIVEHPLIGNLDQFSDRTDLLDSPALRPDLRRLYE